VQAFKTRPAHVSQIGPVSCAKYCQPDLPAGLLKSIWCDQREDDTSHSAALSLTDLQDLSRPAFRPVRQLRAVVYAVTSRDNVGRGLTTSPSRGTLSARWGN